MTLPVPYQSPVAPLSFFTEQTVPGVLIDFHPSVYPYRQKLIATALNTIIGRATFNGSRMFCFNMCSQNNFRNEIVLDLIRFINDYSNMLYLKKQSSTMMEIIESVCDTAALILTSLLTFKFPELRSYISPQENHGAQENVIAFRKILNEIESFYKIEVPYFRNLSESVSQQRSESVYNPQYPQQQMQWVYDPATGQPICVPVPPQGGMYVQPQPAMGVYPNQAGYFQGPVAAAPANFQSAVMPSGQAFNNVQNNMGQGSGFGSFTDKFDRNSQPQPKPFVSKEISEFFTDDPSQSKQEHTAAEQTPSFSWSVAQWETSLLQPYLTLPRPQCCEEVFVQNPENEKRSYQKFIFKEYADGREFESAIMDKTAHLKFLSKSQVENLATVSNRAEQLFRIDSAAIETQQKRNNIFEPIASMIHPTAMLVCSVDDLIQKACMQVVLQDCPLYRIFGYTADYLYTKTDVNSLAKTIAEQAKSMKPLDFISEFRLMYENTQQGDYAKYLKFLDYVMAREVNRFTAGSLGVKIGIDSVATDFADLQQMIENRFPQIFLSMFHDFVKKLIEKLFNPPLSAEDENEFIKNYLEMDDECENQNLYASILMRPVSLTYVESDLAPLLSPEAIRAIKNVSMKVDPKIHPTLYRIVRSAFEQTGAILNIDSALQNILKFSQSSQLFEIFQGVLDKDVYLIRAI
jgi:hypothetical protein